MTALRGFRQDKGEVMSIATTEHILDEIHGERHTLAIWDMAQVLADAEAPNFSIRQQAHEDLQALRIELGNEYDVYLAEALAFMIEAEVAPHTWEA